MAPSPRPATPGDPLQTVFDRGGEMRRAFGLEAQFDGRFDLVHILAARSRRAREALGHFPVGESQGVGNAQHGETLLQARAAQKPLRKGKGRTLRAALREPGDGAN